MLTDRSTLIFFFQIIILTFQSHPTYLNFLLYKYLLYDSTQ